MNQTMTTAKKLNYNSVESRIDKYTLFLMLNYCTVVTAVNDTDSYFCHDDQGDRSVLP